MYKHDETHKPYGNAAKRAVRIKILNRMILSMAIIHALLYNSLQLKGRTYQVVRSLESIFVGRSKVHVTLAIITHYSRI